MFNFFSYFNVCIVYTVKTQSISRKLGHLYFSTRKITSRSGFLYIKSNPIDTKQLHSVFYSFSEGIRM